MPLAPRLRQPLVVALAAGWLAGVVPAGAQEARPWVDPPTGSAAPAPRPPEPAPAAPPPDGPQAEPAPAQARAPDAPARASSAAKTPEAPAAKAVAATPAGTFAKPERRAAPRRAARAESPGRRVAAAARPAPRAARPVSRVARAAPPRSLEMLRIRTIELPDGRQVEIVTRLGSVPAAD